MLFISSIPSAQDSGISTHLARDTSATRNAAECWNARLVAHGRPKNKTNKNIDFIGSRDKTKQKCSLEHVCRAWCVQ